MNKKALIILLVVVLVGGGIAFALTRNAPSAAAPTSPEAASPSGLTDKQLNSPDAPYQWSFKTTNEDAVEGPDTAVSLIAGGTTHDLGTVKGSCSIMVAPQLMQNQKSGALCWWAGAGDEFGVFEENGALVVKRGVQDEGTAEGGGFRGDFKTVLTL